MLDICAVLSYITCEGGFDKSKLLRPLLIVIIIIIIVIEEPPVSKNRRPLPAPQLKSLIPPAEQEKIGECILAFAAQTGWNPRVIPILARPAKCLPLELVKAVLDKCLLHNASSPAYYHKALLNAYKDYTAALKTELAGLRRARQILVLMRKEGAVPVDNFLKSEWLRNRAADFQPDKSEGNVKYETNADAAGKCLARLQDRIAEIEPYARLHHWS